MSAPELDYLVIGHITRDRTPDGGFTIGGTAAYAARTAWALGCRVRVVTSADPSLELDGVLPDVEVRRVPAPTTTTFHNRYTPTGRVQTVEGTAAQLTPDAVPPDWRPSGVVHLGPVARECDPALARLFPRAFLGLTPQGWMRAWDGTGRVRPARWENADDLLPHADAVVLSEEDVGGDEELVARWAGLVPVLALTRGARGCTLYVRGEPENVDGFPAAEVDATGAGDVFAAVLFVELKRGVDPRAAARLANCVAARSVTRPGLSGTPTAEEIARCRAVCA